MRVGIGVDVHKLVAGRPLILGGVCVPFEKGLLGHSDADVLSHAICDALLGAARLGDIGEHFPDTDERFQGISSLTLLENVAALLAQRDYGVVNVDATVMAQAPKVGPYFPEMTVNIARSLRIEEGQVNLKATTSEGLGYTGAGQGITAWAVALVSSTPENPLASL